MSGSAATFVVDQLHPTRSGCPLISDEGAGWRGITRRPRGLAGMGAIHRWQDEWQSVDVARLSVDEARLRLDIVRERLHEGVSYVGQEADAEHRHELEAKVLAEAEAGQIREELHAARDRAASKDDPTVKTAEEQSASRLSPTFLRRADTAELASELSSPAGGGTDRAWQETVERALRDHRRVDQIADMALDELRRWDVLSGSQADGGTLRKLAAAAEELRGPDGLAQFLSRLKSLDHRFHSHQLEHFSATIGREAATEMDEKMKGRDVDVGPARPIESYFESFGGDVKEGQVSDDLAVIRDVLVARVEALVEAVEHGVKHPLEAAEEAIDAVGDLPVTSLMRSVTCPKRQTVWRPGGQLCAGRPEGSGKDAGRSDRRRRGRDSY